MGVTAWPCTAEGAPQVRCWQEPWPCWLLALLMLVRHL